MLNILLPVKNNQPDYETMSIVISAIHKIVIQNVVTYTDKKINATKRLLKISSVSNVLVLR